MRKEDLKKYFIDGCKKENDLKIGVEWEKIGVLKESAKAIPYSGPRSVTAIFKALIANYQWKPVLSDSSIIALQKNKSSITLEPGGQIELSGQKSAFLLENARELYSHLNELKKVSDPLGIAWLGIGLQPISSLNQIEWTPKKRYGIMRESLKGKGSQTHAMMKQTASIQVSLDYTSESDATEKLRLGLGLAPILSALFANSPIAGGKKSGFLSRRSFIWLHTAPERSGIIPAAFKKGFGFEDYVEYALSVPLLFLVRKERWIPVKGINFGTYLNSGYQGIRPTWEDWVLHLSTIFTDARLKTYLEIRSIDCQKKDLGLSVPALIKGIFYSKAQRKRAWELVEDLSIKQRKQLAFDGAKVGLKAKLKGKPLIHYAKFLLEWAEEGLEKGEVQYLSPLKELLIHHEITPAEILLGCFHKGLTHKEKIQRILNCAAI